MQYLFTQASFDKPFFTTYFKTSLFTIYLSAFIFWRPWQRLCWCEWRKRKKQSGETGRSKEAAKSHDQERQCLLGESGADERGVVDEGVGREGRGAVSRRVGEEEGEKTEGTVGEGGAEESKVLREERREGEEVEGGTEGGGWEGRGRGDGCEEGWERGRRSQGEVTIEDVTVCGDGRRREGGVCVVADVDPSTGAAYYHEPSVCTSRERSINCQEGEAESRPLRFMPQGGSMEECPLPKPDVCLLVS